MPPPNISAALRLDPHTDLVIETHMMPSGRPESVQPLIGLLKLDRRAWIVLALEVSENAVRGNHELRTPQLFYVFEIFDHTRSLHIRKYISIRVEPAALVLRLW
jgi:hypothetical protein